MLFLDLVSVVEDNLSETDDNDLDDLASIHTSMVSLRDHSHRSQVRAFKLN